MTKSEQITSEKLEDHVETLSPDSFCDVTEHFQHEFEALEYQTSVHPSALSPSDLIKRKKQKGFIVFDLSRYFEEWQSASKRLLPRHPSTRGDATD